jgi:hypothetical protein
MQKSISGKYKLHTVLYPFDPDLVDPADGGFLTFLRRGKCLEIVFSKQSLRRLSHSIQI